jgi:uncharacterized protein (TIGR03435 family)
MRQGFIRGSIALLLISCSFGQTPPARTEFIVANIKQNKSADDPSNILMSKGQFTAHNVSLKLLLGEAFGVAPRFVDLFISGAPAWVDSENFDLVAKVPPDTTEKNLAPMLQVFLEDEFKLAVHREEKPTNVFALVVKGEPKLQIGAGPGEAVCKRSAGGPAPDGQQHVACSGMRMADLVAALPNLAPRYIDLPVLDSTGLMEAYDFRLDWAGRAALDDGGLTIFDSLGRLGLKLEQRKLPMLVIVIDHIDRLSRDH